MSETDDRFWSKVDRTGDCWLWTAGTTRRGYGVFHPRHGETIGAHRWSLSQSLGRDLASSEFACHTCDNPACVRPAHLFAGSHDDNMADMRSKGRSSRGSRRPGARLTAASVLSIREAAAAGVPSRELAAAHGVVESNVCMIIRGKRWAHVGGPITEHYLTRKAA